MATDTGDEEAEDVRKKIGQHYLFRVTEGIAQSVIHEHCISWKRETGYFEEIIDNKYSYNKYSQESTSKVVAASTKLYWLFGKCKLTF